MVEDKLYINLPQNQITQLRKSDYSIFGFMTKQDDIIICHNTTIVTEV